MERNITLGKVIYYGNGAFIGELTGIVLGSTVALNSINDTSVYEPIHDRITQLQRHNHAISTVTEQHVLNGYSGRTATEAFLSSQSHKNTATIQELQSKEPHQLSPAAEVGVVVGLGWVGAVAGLAVAHAARKAVSSIRSRHKKPETAEADAGTS